jgi:hypothetical protein
MTEEQMYQEMLEKAKQRGVYPNKNAKKIAAFRVRAGLPITKCPCDPNSDRGCISKRCYMEIIDNGICHCRCFTKEDTNV